MFARLITCFDTHNNIPCFIIPNMPHSLSQSCSYVMLRVWRMLAEKERRRCFYVRSTLNAVSSKIEVLGYAIEKNYITNYDK